ncbi:MerR family transcriptional regulator [Vagococcus acidifermentans]|uniref:MerR family transcriptional regulator n=1 Tax=Vagococcus acidifermentans TaxID=564710 RepID=A0A430AMK6_9ENTE|nr:MerR family transcriptional regulator [Vagococcus acidifermentans]RSU09325.1 MerR family transcriptional regulator [Vagococcus acidifermentans]
MSEKELRRSMAVFPMSSVMQLTDLTARKIRYYEEQGLIHPQRNDGNNRVFSLNDIDRLLEIKDYLAAGFSIKEIQKTYARQTAKKGDFSESDIRQALYKEILNESGLAPFDPFQKGRHHKGF